MIIIHGPVYRDEHALHIVKQELQVAFTHRTLLIAAHHHRRNMTWGSVSKGLGGDARDSPTPSSGLLPAELIPPRQTVQSPLTQSFCSNVIQTSLHDTKIEMFILKWQIIFVPLKHLFLHISVLVDSIFYVPHLHAIKKSETREGNISFVQADSRKVQQFSQYASPFCWSTSVKLSMWN